MSVPAPTNAYAAHIGNGIVQVHVEHSNYSLVKQFEVLTSDALTGTYVSVSNNKFPGADGFLYGFVTGRTIYMKVRAIGADNSLSAYIQVKLGVASKPAVVMKCTGVKGSIINAGSIFTASKDHRVYGVKNTSQINFT